MCRVARTLDRSEERWRVGHRRLAARNRAGSAAPRGVEGIARAPPRPGRIGDVRQLPAAQRAGQTWASPKLIRNAQYEQPVIWPSLQQTSGEIDPLRACATYERSPHLSPNVVSHISSGASPDRGESTPRAMGAPADDAVGPAGFGAALQMK